jgi:hypothetical protein
MATYDSRTPKWLTRSVYAHFAAAAVPYNFKLASDGAPVANNPLDNWAELHLKGPDITHGSFGSNFCLQVFLYVTCKIKPNNIYAIETMLEHFQPSFSDICVKKFGDDPSAYCCSLRVKPSSGIQVIRFGKLDDGLHVQAAITAEYEGEV